MKLIGTDGTRYYSWILVPGKYTIGRKAGNDFCVPDATISRSHAEIEVPPAGENIYVKDLGSHNGTFFNNARIESRVQLKPGDRIMFGDAEFKLAHDNESTTVSTKVPVTAKLTEKDFEKLVFLSIDEALKPLPEKVTDLPELFPTLSEMARLLVLNESKEVMLERSLEMVAKVIPAERLAILFTSENQEDIYIAASLLTEGKDPGSFTLSRTIIKNILTDKQSILISDTAEDSRFSDQQSIILSELKSAMAVPLFDEGKVLGILYIDTSNPIHHYSDDYLRLLATFGNIIASRLLNYQLLSERQEKQVIEAELKRASSIQANMLVESIPSLPGYETFAFQEQSRQVGGDLYDVAMLPDGRLLFMVGDVSGKGMGAALLMSNILASFRILYNTPDFKLNDVVDMVSGQMLKYTPPEMFATLFIGLVDPMRHLVSFINAGHNPPLIVRTDGKLEHLEPSGIMIGAFDVGGWTEDKMS